MRKERSYDRPGNESDRALMRIGRAVKVRQRIPIFRGIYGVIEWLKEKLEILIDDGTRHCRRPGEPIRFYICMPRIQWNSVAIHLLLVVCDF